MAHVGCGIGADALEDRLGDTPSTFMTLLLGVMAQEVPNGSPPPPTTSSAPGRLRAGARLAENVAARPVRLAAVVEHLEDRGHRREVHRASR